MSFFVSTSSWLKDYVTAIKNKRLHPFTPLERKVREATRKIRQSVPTALLQEIADATYDDEASQEIILAVLSFRLQYPPEKWVNVYKALTLLEFLLRRGHEAFPGRVREDLRPTLEAIAGSFDFFDLAEGRDRGSAVRHRAAVILQMLQEPERLAEIRRSEREASERSRRQEGAVEAGTSGRPKHRSRSVNASRRKARMWGEGQQGEDSGSQEGRDRASGRGRPQRNSGTARPPALEGPSSSEDEGSGDEPTHARAAFGGLLMGGSSFLRSSMQRHPGPARRSSGAFAFFDRAPSNAQDHSAVQEPPVLSAHELKSPKMASAAAYLSRRAVGRGIPSAPAPESTEAPGAASSSSSSQQPPSGPAPLQHQASWGDPSVPSASPAHQPYQYAPRPPSSQPPRRARAVQSGEENDRLTSRLKTLIREVPGNSRCADCHASPTLWYSANLGIFLCNNCAGVHRGLGVHVSFIRSVALDRHATCDVAFLASTGNLMANAHLEALLPLDQPRPSTAEDRKAFCHRKYVERQWALQHVPWPPPVILEDGPPATVPDPQPSTAVYLVKHNFSTTNTHSVSSAPSTTLYLAPNPPSLSPQTSSAAALPSFPVTAAPLQASLSVPSQILSATPHYASFADLPPPLPPPSAPDRDSAPLPVSPPPEDAPDSARLNAGVFALRRQLTEQVKKALTDSLLIKDEDELSPLAYGVPPTAFGQLPLGPVPSRVVPAEVLEAVAAMSLQIEAGTLCLTNASPRPSVPVPLRAPPPPPVRAPPAEDLAPEASFATFVPAAPPPALQRTSSMAPRLPSGSGRRPPSSSGLDVSGLDLPPASAFHPTTGEEIHYVTEEDEAAPLLPVEGPGVGLREAYASFPPSANASGPPSHNGSGAAADFFPPQGQLSGRRSWLDHSTPTEPSSAILSPTASLSPGPLMFPSYAEAPDVLAFLDVVSPAFTPGSITPVAPFHRSPRVSDNANSPFVAPPSRAVSSGGIYRNVTSPDSQQAPPFPQPGPNPFAAAVAQSVSAAVAAVLAPGPLSPSARFIPPYPVSQAHRPLIDLSTPRSSSTALEVAALEAQGGRAVAPAPLHPHQPLPQRRPSASALATDPPPASTGTAYFAIPSGLSGNAFAGLGSSTRRSMDSGYSNGNGPSGGIPPSHVQAPAAPGHPPYIPLQYSIQSGQQSIPVPLAYTSTAPVARHGNSVSAPEALAVYDFVAATSASSPVVPPGPMFASPPAATSYLAPPLTIGLDPPASPLKHHAAQVQGNGSNTWPGPGAEQAYYTAGAGAGRGMMQ